MKRVRWSLVRVAGITMILCGALAAGSAVAIDSWNIDFVASLPGYLHQVEVAGGFAYGATGSGLLVLDIATGGDPAQVAFCPLQGVSALAIEDHYAYLTAYEGAADGTLIIVDIEDPSRPVPIGRFEGCYGPSAISVRNAIAYVADSWRGLRIIDLSDPASPAQIGYLPMTRPLGGMELVGPLLFLADSDAGLRVIDVGNPTNPVEIGRYDPGYEVRDVAIGGSYAYIACSPGIRVVDIANPRAPTLVDSFVFPIVECLALRSGYLYLSHFESIRVLDVADPRTPVQTGLLDILGRARNVAFAGTRAYVAAYFGGLRVLDLQEPGSPIEVASYFLLGDAYGLNVRDDRLYLAGGYRVSDQLAAAKGRSPLRAATSGEGERRRDTGTAGLYVVDLRDPSKPLLRSWTSYGNALDVALRDSLACVTDWGGHLGVFSIADPDHPCEIGSAETGYWTTDLDVDARYAYVLIEYDLLIFDLIDPRHPVQVGGIRAGTTAIDVDGSYAYLLDYYYGLSIVDISNPYAPAVVGQLEMDNWAEGLTVEGGYAYVANGAHGLRVIDVRDPRAPVDLGVHDTPGYAVAVTRSGDRAYVADHEGGVRVFDVSVPSTPAEMGYFVTPTWAEDVTVRAGTIVVGCSDGGIFVLRNRIPAETGEAEAAPLSVRLDQNLPNPALGATRIRFSVPSERMVRLSVLSVDGRRVADIFRGSVSAGVHSIEWSGRDDRGQPLPSGSYVYRLDAGEPSVARRLVLIRR